MRPYLLSTVVGIGSTIAYAEPASLPSINETQLIARVSQDPRLARIGAEIQTARADAIIAGVRDNPVFSIEREEVFPSGGQSTNYFRFEIPLGITGRRTKRAEAALATSHAVAIEGEGTTFAVTIDALRKFRTAAYERQRVALLRVERDALVKAVEIVRKRTTAGSASGYDLQRVQLELAVYDDQIAAADASLATARVQLGAVVGAPDGIDADAGLDIPPDPAPIDVTLRNSVENRAEFRAAGARIESARLLARAAGRARLPELGVSGGLMRADVSVGMPAYGYSAALFITLPVFDRGQAERARAGAIAKTADAERAVLAREIPARVRAAHSMLTQTIARAKTVRDAQLAKLEQLLRSAETAYRDGGGNVIELLDAHTKARDARLRDLEIRRDARLAELDLWLALGRRP